MVPGTVFCLALLIAAAEAAQCQLGLRLFSVEGGKALCAPFVHFGCIEACEWTSGCEKTAPWRAFGHGRRSFVAGMLLSNQSFYVQCCVSMSTFVPRNEDCRWTKFEEVVTGDHFSLRIEPVIRSNEYIRNVVMERPNTQFAAKAQMRLEICRFRTHRQHCNRELMPEEDKRLYDLLLLRLSRASLLTRNVTITAPPMVPTAAARFEAQPSAFVDSDINRIDSTKNDLKRLHRDNPIVKVDTDNNTVDQGGERCRRRSKRTLGETEACHGVFKSCCEAKVGEKCRDICSLKADKTTINEILKKRNCPLLSLISVLRCFNDVYDTSSVATCCRAADKRIPSQCHDACSPNFKLSYKHLHCVEHVVDVYHCYRTLFSETPFHVNK